MGGIESNVVYGIQRILLGQALYQDPAAGSYAVMQYTPLYYYCVASVASIVGTDGHDVQGIYMLCRVIALMLNLLTVIAAASIIRVWKFNWLQSLLLATPILIILTSHYFLRGDSMHLLFFVSAIGAYIQYLRKQRVPDVILFALLSAACIMCKQSGVLVAGITGSLLLFTERRYLASLVYTICTIMFALLIACLCVGNAWTTFYQNAYLGLKNGIDLAFLYNMFISQFFLELVPCYLLGGALVYFAIKQNKNKVFTALVTGMALSWLFAVVTGIKIGSSNNYFVEFITLLVIALPYLLQNELSKTMRFTLFSRRVSVYIFACFALFVLTTSKALGLFTAVCIEKSIKNTRAEYEKELVLYKYFKEELALQPGERILFTERNYLDNIFIDYAIMPTKDVVSETYLADSATYDYSAFTKGLNNGLVKYIVADERKKDVNRWYNELPFMLIDLRKFRLIANKEGYAVYIYKE